MSPFGAPRADFIRLKDIQKATFLLKINTIHVSNQKIPQFIRWSTLWRRWSRARQRWEWRATLMQSSSPWSEPVVSFPGNYQLCMYVTLPLMFYSVTRRRSWRSTTMWESPLLASPPTLGRSRDGWGTSVSAQDTATTHPCLCPAWSPILETRCRFALSDMGSDHTELVSS